jgi:hypothetical protein
MQELGDAQHQGLQHDLQSGGSTQEAWHASKKGLYISSGSIGCSLENMKISKASSQEASANNEVVAGANAAGIAHRAAHQHQQPAELQQ